MQTDSEETPIFTSTTPLHDQCFRKLLKGLMYVPRVVITDKLKRYGAAKREILPGVEHRQSRYLNNRCEHSHRPTRQREHRMQGFSQRGMPRGSSQRMD